MKAFGMRPATTVAGLIVEASLEVPNCPLTAIWLFGPIAGAGMGRDIDLILEVDKPTYEKYAKFCHVALDGVHAFSSNMLEAKHSAVYDHLSPKGDRTMAALGAIGIDLYKLGFGAVEDSLNVVCLPPDWKSGPIYNYLAEKLGKDDAGFLYETAETSIKVFPQD